MEICLELKTILCPLVSLIECWRVILELKYALSHYADFSLFSRVHATLQPALSVRRSVRRSVRWSVRHTLLFCTITSTLRSF